MENATKALFIAIGVLIGLMILSLGVALYYSLQGYISDTQDTMQQNADSQFNAQYLKYINMQLDSMGAFTGPDGKKYSPDFKLRIQDVITAANNAYQNNRELRQDITTINPDTDYNENSLYVTVNAILYNETGTPNMKKNLELTVNEEASKWLSNTYNAQYRYQCYSAEVLISPVTGRVYEITFR